MDLGGHTFDICLIPLLRTITGAATAGNQTTLVDHCAVQGHSYVKVKIY